MAASLTIAAPNAAGNRAECVTIRAERPNDASAREALLDEALGATRFKKTSARLRAGRLPAEGLALVAEEGDALVGTVRLWLVRAGGVAALLLGPLAVAISHRGLGLGASLVREAIALAAERGHRAIVLVGDAPYYARFGFAAELAAGLALPGPVERARFLGLELAPGALRGVTGVVVAAGPLAPCAGPRAHRRRRAA